MTVSLFFVATQKMLGLLSTSSLQRVESNIRPWMCADSLEDQATAPCQAYGEGLEMTVHRKAAQWLSACHLNKPTLRRTREWGGARIWPYFISKGKLSHMLGMKFIFQSSMIKEIQPKAEAISIMGENTVSSFPYLIFSSRRRKHSQNQST